MDAVEIGGLSRRSLIGLAGTAVALGAAPLRAQWARDAEVVELWPGTPPNQSPTQTIHYQETENPRGNRVIRGIARPTMTVCRAAKPNGAAMLLIPGGGYSGEVIDGGGTKPAAWLNARGVTAFILTYRLPKEGWTNPADVPLQDAQRAMRLIRANAAKYGVASGRLGVAGFSAGGHLAGSLATRFDEKTYELTDAADAVSARPDLAAMVYPVVTMCPALTHPGSRSLLIGDDSDEARCKRYSVDQRVTAATPPVILFQAADDKVVPVQNSLMMYNAMLAQERPVAMHLFEKGGHGFSTDLPKAQPASAWPDLMLAFAASHGWAQS